MDNFQLTFMFQEGSTPSDMAAKLRFHAGLLEGMAPKSASSRKNTEVPIPTTTVSAAAIEAETDDEDFAKPAKTSKKANGAAKSFEDDSDDTHGEEEDFTAPPAKTKTKKITIDDCNDACKARAAKTGGKEGREEVLALLKKHFKTTSVSGVSPDDYEKLVKVMKV